MLAMIFAVAITSTPAPMPSAILRSIERAETILVAKVVSIDSHNCAVRFAPVEILRGKTPTGDVDVDDCGRKRGNQKRTDNIPIYAIDEVDVLFVVDDRGRPRGWSFRYDYWNENLPWSYEVRRSHVERVLSANHRRDRDPSDATDVVAMVDSDDEMLVRLGLSFVRKDLAGDKRLPHKDLARALLRIATQKSCPEGSDLSSELALAILKYADAKLDLDESTRTALEAEGNRREKANRTTREANRRAASR